MEVIGKVMIISFETDEEPIFNQIKNLLTNEQFEVIEHKEEGIVASSKMKLYTREHRVEINNNTMVLGRKQFALLLLLMKNSNRIFTKEEIYDYIWNDAVPINVAETVRYHISDIRKKLSNLCGDNFIQTVWGVGYRFCEAGVSRQAEPR